jgi:hypothetical protein
MMTLLNGHGSPPATNLERRRGLRIRQQRAVKVYEPRTSRYYPGQTADISAGGLRLTLPLSTPLIAGNTISLHIDSVCSFAARRHMVQARVIWMHRNESAVMVGLELLTTSAIQSAAA